MNDRKASLFLAFSPTLAMFFALGGFFVGYVRWGRGAAGGEGGAGKMRLAYDRVMERYYVPPPADKVVDGAIEGMTRRLDPYSEYFNAQEWKEFNDVQLEGKFGGVGIVVESDRAGGYVSVVTPIEETPAIEADILPGDQVREVDGKSIKGMAMESVVRRIKGEPGTKVTLTLARKGRDPFRVTLTRALIRVKAVKAKMLDGGVGYVRISDFTKMMEQFDREVGDLQKRGMKALILDLRFNGGGLLPESVKLSDRFLDEGVIVTTRGRTEEDNNVFSAKKDDTLPPFPLAVLVNETSASASEVFAGAIKDHRRGTLVGARTFGKGLVQTPFPFPDGSHLKITTSRYFTPGGVCVHREEGKKDYGLEPDFRVEMSLEEYGLLVKKWNEERIVKGAPAAEPVMFTDLQLEAAIEVVRAKLEGRPPKVEPRILQKDKPAEE